MISMTFVDFVQHRLREMGWSGHDLASALGYDSAGLVYRVLKSGQKPPLKRVGEWAKALKLDDDGARQLRAMAEREHIPLGMRARIQRLETTVEKLEDNNRAKDVVIDELRGEIKRLKALLGTRSTDRTTPRP